MTGKENTVAKALMIVGYLAIVVGMITGFSYGSQEELGELRGVIGLSLFVSGIIWGIVFFGFSEVIKLLQGIYNQGIPKRSVIDTLKEQGSSATLEVNENKVEARSVSEVARREIDEFFKDRGNTVQSILLTDREDFYLVTVDGEEVVVELGGFKPIIRAKR
ncbi:hypothetical protein IMZ08_14370 [Bacillus luteolus]|uniref:Uncharacterized protein n=1 Tax=Litchfieldia luteola TaxID=682179 RepID=A0ABR9QL73_9BACI|nr:hypothetical protein [Cytobacillus luteolus]MBE4909248.1 hypothetical protein [Cytobacillus luteolus]MBP1940295.1 hypothetical protein [Cytobacillus luteolus]